MRRKLSSILAAIFFGSAIALVGAPQSVPLSVPAETEGRTYLGFDTNQYPGDGALALLRQTFSFSGYWLNTAPGETSNSWRRKRGILSANGFGFLVLFNGRMERELKSVSNATALGVHDGADAIEAGRAEQFPAGAIIFLDQEEGGRMTPVQRAYVYAWIDAVGASGYRAGVYCSGIAVRESGGVTITTANDLRDNAARRQIAYFVYNDTCPPSPGCAFPREAPPPKRSGTSFAAVWQFAQSPKRRELTRGCTFKYDADGNCYAPLVPRKDGVRVDVESADSPDPSHGR